MENKKCQLCGMQFETNDEQIICKKCMVPLPGGIKPQINKGNVLRGKSHKNKNYLDEDDPNYKRQELLSCLTELKEYHAFDDE